MQSWSGLRAAAAAAPPGDHPRAAPASASRRATSRQSARSVTPSTALAGPSACASRTTRARRQTWMATALRALTTASRARRGGGAWPASWLAGGGGWAGMAGLASEAACQLARNGGGRSAAPGLSGWAQTCGIGLAACLRLQQPAGFGFVLAFRLSWQIPSCASHAWHSCPALFISLPPSRAGVQKVWRRQGGWRRQGRRRRRRNARHQRRRRRLGASNAIPVGGSRSSRRRSWAPRPAAASGVSAAPRHLRRRACGRVGGCGRSCEWPSKCTLCLRQCSLSGGAIRQAGEGLMAGPDMWRPNGRAPWPGPPLRAPGRGLSWHKMRAHLCGGDCAG